MSRNLFLVRVTLLPLLLAAVAVSDLAQAQALRPLSHTMLKCLVDIETAIDQAVNSAQSINVEVMKLSTQERKSLQDTRARTVKPAEFVRKQTDLLRRPGPSVLK